MLGLSALKDRHHDCNLLVFDTFKLKELLYAGTCREDMGLIMALE